MFVLGLLAVVALVGTQIFLFTMRTSAQLSRQHQAQAQFDQAAAQLRRDVWSASSLELPEPQVLKVKLADGQEVTWHAGTVLDRRVNSQLRGWDALDADITFEVRGPTVTIAIDPQKSDARGTLTLVSQAMLLQGERR